MARKRKAGDDITGTRHRAAARTEPTAGDDLAGRSGQTAGPTANAAGDGVAGTSPAMAWLLAVTSGYAVGSSQFDGAARGRGAGGGSGHRGFSQSQPRRREPQMPSQGMLRPPLANPAGGRPPFTNQCHAPTGHGSLPGQTQNNVAGPRQTGTEQPRGHSGGGGPPTAITSGASVSPLSLVCTLCKRPTTGVWGLVPLCVDCYNNRVTSNVVQQHPEIRYVPPRPVPSYGGATQGHGIAIGHQRQLDLRQSSYAGLALAAAGPLTRAPSADWCTVCLEPTMGALDSLSLMPLCVDCYNRLFVAGDAPPQHAQTGGHVLPSPVPASEQRYQAAAIRPPSSSTSSSAVGSGPICQACGHPSGTGNRACSVCHRNGPPPPELG